MESSSGLHLASGLHKQGRGQKSVDFPTPTHCELQDPGMFDDKSIFISGGTGSFGRAFIKRLLEQYKPRRVVVFSRDELKQYEICLLYTSPSPRD